MLYVVPLDRSAGDDLIKAVRVTPGRPLTFGTWHELPIIAVGPRGGKIVGYRRGHIPIYAGSRRAKMLAGNAAAVGRVSKKKVPDHLTWEMGEEYKELVTHWLTDVHGMVLSHGNAPQIYISPHSDLPGGKHSIGFGNISGKLVYSLGFKTIGEPDPSDYKFALEDVLAGMKAAPAPAPPPQEQAVVAAETASGQVEQDPFPDLSTLKEIEAGKAAGSHGNKLFVSKGEKWLFKPTDPIIARAEVAATQIGRFLLPGERIQAGKMVTIKGQEGVLLSWLKGKLIPQGDHSHPGLDLFQDPANFSQFVYHHVIDWLISNHDGHAGNWLYRDDPGDPDSPMKDICGIDKGQSWRFFGEDKLSVDYSPNHSTPIYNKIWKAWREGSFPAVTKDQVIANVGSAVNYVQHKLTADQMAAIVGPYALARAAKEGIDAAALIKQMQGRLAGLRTDFEHFLTDLIKQPVKLESPSSKKAPQEPAKAPAPTPKAPPVPIAQPAPAQAAPAKEKAPPGEPIIQWKPITKGNFKLAAQGKKPSAGMVWPTGYPGPGTVLEITYKGQPYKVAFEEGAGKPFITVTYPDKENKSFYSPNAAGDSLYLWHNKFPLDMSATEKKAKKLGASAKVTLGIKKFTDAELGLAPPGAAAASPSVLEDQGVVPSGAETVSLGTLLSQEIGSHGIVAKPELLPQAVKDYLAGHPYAEPPVGSTTGIKPLLPMGQVLAYRGDNEGNLLSNGGDWWFAVPSLNTFNKWHYRLFHLAEGAGAIQIVIKSAMGFESNFSVDTLKAWEKEFEPPAKGEGHQGAPSPDNWETMPDEDANIGWKGLDPDSDIMSLGAGSTVHWMAGKVKWSFFHWGAKGWAAYKDGVYQGAVTTHDINMLKGEHSPTKVYLGQSEKLPSHSPDIQPALTTGPGVPPKSVLPPEAVVPPTTSQFHSGLLADGTTISLTKPFKLSPTATAELVGVPVTLTASGGAYELKYHIPGVTHTQTFKTLTAAALALQAAQAGYPTLAAYIDAKGKPEKMPTWQVWGINVEPEAPEAIEAELTELAPKAKPVSWESAFVLTGHGSHADPAFYQAAPVGSVISLTSEVIPGGTKKGYLKKIGVGDWVWYSGGIADSHVTSESIPAILKVYWADSPLAYAGAPVDNTGKEATFPGYAAAASTLSSGAWLDHLFPGSEVWTQFDGFAPKKWVKQLNGGWFAFNGNVESSSAIFDYVSEKVPDHIGIFVSGFTSPDAVKVPPVTGAAKGFLKNLSYGLSSLYAGMNPGAAIAFPPENKVDIAYVKQDSGQWFKLLDGVNQWPFALDADEMAAAMKKELKFTGVTSVTIADGPSKGSKKLPPVASSIGSIEASFLEGMTPSSKVWLETPMALASWEKQPSGKWKLSGSEDTVPAKDLAAHFALYSDPQNKFGVFPTGYQQKGTQGGAAVTVPETLTSDQETAYKKSADLWFQKQHKIFPKWVTIYLTPAKDLYEIAFGGKDADKYLTSQGLKQNPVSLGFKLQDVLTLMAQGKFSPVAEAEPPPLPKSKSGNKAKANKHLTYPDTSAGTPIADRWTSAVAEIANLDKVEKPEEWPAWAPPPGLPLKMEIDGKTFWLLTRRVATYYGPEKMQFCAINSEGALFSAKSYLPKSASLALKWIFVRMLQTGQIKSGAVSENVASLKKLTGLDKAVFAAGETWKSVLEGAGISGLPTTDDVAPGKTTENATPSEKKTPVKSSWQKLSILKSKVGPAKKYGDALKTTTGKLGLQNVTIDGEYSDKSAEKVTALIKELGLEDAIQEPLGHPQQAWGAAWYTVSMSGLSAEMVIETDWSAAQSAKQGKPEPKTASQVPLSIPKTPKYDPAKLAAMKAAAAEKVAKAKELHAWTKQYPLVSDSADLLALSHFQKSMKDKVPDFRMWARASGFENMLVASPHEASNDALGALLEGKATKVDTLLGPMYRVKRSDLLQAVGVSVSTIKGPDGKTYPAGTTFTSHTETTTKADALKPLITKVSEHKTDPGTYKMAKVSGTGAEQKTTLAQALTTVGLEFGEIKTGESYTMAPVKIADLEKVHKQETVHEPSIPEQPPPFTSAPLPSLALRDADKDRQPAENNRGDFSAAALSGLFLGKFGHKIRIGHAGILKDSQIAVRRVRDKNGGMYYQVSGELLKFDGDDSKLQEGEIAFPTASTLKIEGVHHVHNYNPVEDVHVEEGTKAGDIQETSGWVGVTENGSKISVATGNRTVRNNFYVRIPVDKDVEAEMHNALTRMGVDADAAMAVPTPDDERLLIKAGVLRAGLGSARWSGEYDQTKLGNETYLDAQIKKHSLQKYLAGARIETVFGGQQTVVLDDADEITKRVPYALRTVRQLHHTWRNILEGAGWGSRKSQVENGLWAAGASSSSDWGGGGAIGTLTRGGFPHLDGESWGNIEMYNTDSPVKVIFHPRIFQRADWWGNSKDDYGKPNPGPVGRYNRLSSSVSNTNEFAFEGGVSMRDVAGIACEDPSDKVKIIAELEKGGLSEVNGIPLDDFVVVGPKKSRSWIAKNLKGLKLGVLP